MADLTTQKRKRGRPRKQPAEIDNIQTVKQDNPKEGIEQPVVEQKVVEQEEVASTDDTSNDEVKLSPKKQELKDYYDHILYLSNKDFQVKPNADNYCVCNMCHVEKPHTDFFRSYSYRDIGNMLQSGERHIAICKRCAKKLFTFYYEQEHHDLYRSLHHWCQTLDIYFSKEIYEAMIVLHNSRKGTEMEWKFDYLTDYITTLGRARRIGQTYWDSPCLENSTPSDISIPDDFGSDAISTHEYPDELLKWDKEDLANYDYVLEVYHYDPFQDEDIEDRKKLYYNLAGLSSEDILDDFAKANAAIDTCRSMVRLEKLNKLRIKAEHSANPDIREIKEITVLQKAERQNITLQGKEHGFTQKYNVNKVQGAGTFTGIVKQMDDHMFEDALVNAYDIKTSNAMQMAAEASWKAIFGQLNLSESEFSQIVQNQRETITKLRDELDSTKEKLRLANISIKRQELQEKLDAEEQKEQK